MKLQAKVLSGYAASLSLVVLVGLWGVFNLWRLGQASGDILEENYRSIRAADSMIDSLERQDSATLILLLGDAGEGRSIFREYQVQFLQWLGRAKDNVTLPSESEILIELETAYEEYLLSVDQLIAAPENRTDEYEQAVRPAFQIVRASAAELRDTNQSAMSAAAERAAATSRQAIASVATAGLSAAAVGFIISWLLSRNLIRPVEAIQEATEQIASGNYDVKLAIASRDELGQLADEINIMSQRLQAFKALNLDKVVAEKQRSEAIIYSLSDGIVVVDGQLHIVAINPVAATIFGTKPELAQGRHCLEIIDDRTLYSQIQSVAESQTPVLPAGTQTADADATEFETADDNTRCAELTVERGSVEHYQYLATPVTTPDNRRLGVVLLLQNVTNLKQLDQLKSEFVMTASHELRTPLTGMAMSINLLTETAKTKLSENEQALLQTAQEDVERLRELVNDLLDLSKIESGKLEMEKATVDPKALVEKAIDLLKIQAEDKQIEVTSQTASNLPHVEADINKITWVMTNLIANALRYAKETIKIMTRRHGTWISIAVIDDGPGIDPAYQTKIFDKFVQVKTEKDVGGTGLGLAICKEIIKAHGGTIWVDSTPGQGSTFTFTLPVTSSTPA
ncbi:ATP-binding protein [cf. Phormidesmis sp. LEGE 11477]|uniref:sensor histidine kinase n=1 Tax=cf. Phormidesmis sp. LEGE 11477 TaxID=1828680 RepID=UPI001880D477|nr:ATP-binding protein [cf. Phormidesmis sp. LEGE 11477]MBE9059711.1 HAMP domain-containing protein [cf. Phormidesmis sp. LEGE 11477]